MVRTDAWQAVVGCAGSWRALLARASSCRALLGRVGSRRVLMGPCCLVAGTAVSC